MTMSDGFKLELQWPPDISTDLPTRKSGRCVQKLPKGEVTKQRVCGVPLSFKEKDSSLQNEVLGKIWRNL